MVRLAEGEKHLLGNRPRVCPGTMLGRCRLFGNGIAAAEGEESGPNGWRRIRHGPRPHARAVSGSGLLFFGKPHPSSDLCWAGLHVRGGCEFVAWANVPGDHVGQVPVVWEGHCG